jgi:UDP-N-acetylmuramoylalanine--D-glutamate ligase
MSAESGFLQHERYAVLGAGRSGMAACRLLLARGKNVLLLDEAADPAREDLQPLADAGVALRFGPLPDPAASLADRQAVVVSPGFAWDHPLQQAARAAGIPARSELELGWLCRDGARIVGITGTNGKTTVTMLVERILRDAGRSAVAAGNIGLALCDAVLQAGDGLDQTDFAVEVSSFQLETTEFFTPHVAIVLNVTADHLDRHGSMEAYARAKQRLTDGQGPDDVLVVNQDDAACLAIAQATRARVRRFSLTRPVEDGAWLDGDVIQFAQPGRRPRRLMAMDELLMIGLHNVANAMAAACACQALGVERETIADSLRAFQAAPHRLQPAGEIDGVLFVNDSKATNLDAMLQAIDSFEAGGLLLIAGGRDKNSPLESAAVRLGRRVKEALLIGEAAGPMERAWGASLPCRQCGTLENALQVATDRAEPGDVVLLSPGCASFDQFKSYAHRGESFMEWVRARRETAAGR